LIASIVNAATAGELEILNDEPVPQPIVDDSEPVPTPFH